MPGFQTLTDIVDVDCCQQEIVVSSSYLSYSIISLTYLNYCSSHNIMANTGRKVAKNRQILAISGSDMI